MLHLHINVKRVIIGTLLAAGFFFFSSCFKRGCTDSDGENYEPGAKKDCGCCYYYGKGYLMNNSIHGLNGLVYYVDGVKVKEVNGFIGSYAVAPDQRFYGIYTSEEEERIVELYMGNESVKEFDILVQDSNGSVLYSRRTKVTANHFTLLQ